MNIIGKQYGDWLSGIAWNYIVTLRPHYKLTEYNSERMMRRLARDHSIYRMFYAIEKDRDCNMTHAHLLLEANPVLDRKYLSNKLSINPKAVSYFESVSSPEAVSYYCTKHIGSNISHHNYYEWKPGE